MTNSEQIKANTARMEAVSELLQTKAAGGGQLNAEQLASLVEDSETVVHMLNEDGSKVSFNLGAEQVAKIEQSLKLPLTNHRFSVVGLDGLNEQTFFKIGDGLAIEDGRLKATNAGFDGDFNDLKNVPTASEGTKGLIQIASDLDVVDGTNTTKAINAKQLNDVKQEINDVADDVSTLQTDNTTNKSNISTLQSKVSTLETQTAKQPAYSLSGTTLTITLPE